MLNRKEHLIQCLAEERMKAHIKEGIGDLLSDEEVKKLIDRGMEEVFIKPTKIKNSYNTIDGPPLLNEIIQKELNEVITVQVRNYLLDNNEQVIEAVNKAISGGMAKSLISAVDCFFSGSLMTLRNNVMGEIQTKMQNRY